VSPLHRARESRFRNPLEPAGRDCRPMRTRTVRAMSPGDFALQKMRRWVIRHVAELPGEQLRRKWRTALSY
jgi:hypothetical protein